MQDDSRRDTVSLGSGVVTAPGTAADEIVVVVWEGDEIVVAAGIDEVVVLMGMELTWRQRTSESDKANK